MKLRQALHLRWLPPVVAAELFLQQARRFCSSSLYFVDDPFISMRFAANLVAHGELSFNPGERVEGYSNLLHVLLHALVFRLRGAIPDAATGIDGVVAGVFAATVVEAALLAVLARGSAEREPDATAWYYAGLLTVASWPFAFWATAGLESPLEGMLYVAVLLVGSLRSFRESRQWSLALVAALLVAVTLLRFEGVLVSLAMTAALGLHFVRTGRTRSAVVLGLPVVLAGAAYHLWRFLYFGQLMPNTFVAKATGGSTLARLGAGASYCGSWFGVVGGSLALVVVALAMIRAGRPRRAHLEKLLDRPVLLAACTLVAVKLVLVVTGGGDWMPGWRMLLPVSPIALFLIVRLLLGLVGPRLPRPAGVAALVLALVLAVAGRGAVSAFPARDGIPNEGGHLKKLPQGNVTVGQLLERGFGGSQEEVALGEAGLVPFEAFHVRFMDLFGLVDRDMARQPGFMHSRVHVDHVLARAPAAVLFAHLHMQPPFGPYQYGAELLASPAFHEKYRRIDLGPELETLGWALYLRRDVDPAAHGLVWAPEGPR